MCAIALGLNRDENRADGTGVSVGSVGSQPTQPYVDPYAPPKPGESKVNPQAAKTLDKRVGKLQDDTRNKRCDDIIQNDKNAVKLAAAAPGATPQKRFDSYA